MTEIANSDRAAWALDAIVSFSEETGVDTAVDAITDLIGDLLHLARGRGLETDLIVRNAVAMMRTESLEDSEGEMERVQVTFREILPEDS